MKNNLKVFFIFLILVLSTFSILPIKGVKNDSFSDKNGISQPTKTLGDGITNYWALIVGVNEYAEVYNNERIIEKVNELKGALLKSPTWSEDNIKIITGKNATVRNIIKGLRWLDSNEDLDDICFLYIDAVGYQANFDFPPRDEADGRDEVLITYWGMCLLYANILDDTLNFFLNRLESKGTAIIIDSNHAAGFNDNLWNNTLRNSPFLYPYIKNSLEKFGKELRKNGRVLIMSCEEDDYKGYPYRFTTYLIDAFRGFGDINQDKIITAEEVYTYIKLRMDKWLQIPILYDDFEGELPLLELLEEPIDTLEPLVKENIIEKPIIENQEKNFEEFNMLIDKNLLVDPLVPENSIVCGYIIDNKTNEPLENVNVTLYRIVGEYYTLNYTKSNNQGFYSFNVASGEIALIFHLMSYFDEVIYWIDIEENEILWVNVSMTKPDESSRICGYIKDKITNEPIENTNISLFWTKINDGYYRNYTLSDSLGFYSINVAKGLVNLDIHADGYLDEDWPEDDLFYNISENETKWVNFSLVPKPPENSAVKGYITDNETGEPIQDVNIKIYWWDYQGHYQRNNTKSDSLGFYSINVAKGYIRLYVTNEDYFSARWPYNDDYYIMENETKWVNFSLVPKPPENSAVKGYITDNRTGEPIMGERVELDWKDNEGYSQNNWTYTDSEGFYLMNVAEGFIKLYVYKTGYYDFSWPEGSFYFINDNETKWVNISLIQKPLENSIVKGFITNSKTGDPIKGADIILDWKDEQGNTQYNYTDSDSHGFYSMNVAKGFLRLYVFASNHSNNYTDWFEIEDNESVWLNFTLNPYYYDYTVYGYIKNIYDNSTVQDAYIEFLCKNLYGNYYYESTYSNESGFYSIKLQAGLIDEIYVKVDGFFRYSLKDDYILDENYILWINISLIPYPPETSKVYGYITDSETNEPIKNAEVELDWHEDYYSNLYYYNVTYSDSFGFYSFDVAAGIIDLYVRADGYFSNNTYVYYEIGDYETIWINISLDPFPPQNAIVCGFIKDVNTEEALYGIIYLDWFDFNSHRIYRNSTWTDDNGFYLMNIMEGKIHLEAYAGGYLYEYSNLFNIYENQVLWINLSMYPKPPKNSVICGYIKDAETGKPIENASVDIEWIGCEWHHDDIGMDGETGDDGYYCIDVPAGELYLEAYCDKYHNKEFYRQDISENDTFWFNISLEKKKVDVEILKPASGFYLLNHVLLPFIKPMIFGNIEIAIEVDDCDDLEKLELFIDDELKFHITNEPNDYYYSYLWTKEDTKPFKHEYVIKVIAVDIERNIDSDELKVTRYF